MHTHTHSHAHFNPAHTHKHLHTEGRRRAATQNCRSPRSDKRAEGVSEGVTAWGSYDGDAVNVWKQWVDVVAERCNRTRARQYWRCERRTGCACETVRCAARLSSRNLRADHHCQHQRLHSHQHVCMHRHVAVDTCGQTAHRDTITCRTDGVADTEVRSPLCRRFANCLQR
jgi:hypothetical protein